MKIAFLDPIGWDYSPQTPLTHPLGGSQSALCYLATELVRQGHDVSLINHIASPGEYGGVRCVGWAEGATGAFLNRADVVLVLNAAMASDLRKAGVRPPLVLWTQHAHDQPGISGLRDIVERQAWTGFAFISQWMRDDYRENFHIPPARSRIFHNAIAPAFASRQLAAPWFANGTAPLLVYTSTPFRGLAVLLDAFPSIRAAFPAARLRVYSSMSTYRIAPEKDNFRPLYERCRQMQGVEYVGSIGQVQLATELADAAAFAYPSTFAETFCIAAAEAMSLGALLLTTRLGALPELYGKFAYMTEPDPDRRRLAETYGALVVNALQAARLDPVAASARRLAQIDFIRNNYTWSRIASQWSAGLEELLASGIDSPTPQSDSQSPKFR